eukprot:4249359-Pyramimonas_sp.AAC.2
MSLTPFSSVVFCYEKGMLPVVAAPAGQTLLFHTARAPIAGDAASGEDRPHQHGINRPQPPLVHRLPPDQLPWEGIRRVPLLASHVQPRPCDDCLNKTKKLRN